MRFSKFKLSSRAMTVIGELEGLVWRNADTCWKLVFRRRQDEWRRSGRIPAYEIGLEHYTISGHTLNLPVLRLHRLPMALMVANWMVNKLNEFEGHDVDIEWRELIRCVTGNPEADEESLLRLSDDQVIALYRGGC